MWLGFVSVDKDKTHTCKIFKQKMLMKKSECFKMKKNDWPITATLEKQMTKRAQNMMTNFFVITYTSMTLHGKGNQLTQHLQTKWQLTNAHSATITIGGVNTCSACVSKNNMHHSDVNSL